MFCPSLALSLPSKACLEIAVVASQRVFTFVCSGLRSFTQPPNLDQDSTTPTNRWILGTYYLRASQILQSSLPPAEVIFKCGPGRGRSSRSYRYRCVNHAQCRENSRLKAIQFYLSQLLHVPRATGSVESDVNCVSRSSGKEPGCFRSVQLIAVCPIVPSHLCSI
jgi:hypothetical protein